MAWSAALATPRDRVRFAVGDTSDPPLLPGGETAYNALLAALISEAATARAAASALASRYATQPSSISSSGESVAWAERVGRWAAIAAGETPYPFAAEPSSATSSANVAMEVSW